MKKIAMNLLRAVISFGLLAYLITMADLDKIAGVLAQADFSYIGLALVIFLGGVFVLTLRWQVLLKCVGIEPGYRRLLMYYFIGYFLNNFLPTSIGGDVSRAFNVARHSERRSPGIASILLERVLGLLATMTLASL
ncbi:MAG: flippase-like domain-containing protein, partial [Calditrichaeota bacterium]|nr:flippase-like domain-containing protein [Calditrichota bacterium]MCB0311761.1 flippase-like domain-containing protein [Calditrichota bacterium]